ncbi:hypothetical protein ACJ73_10032 [Blastomyces percursus]|uniref:Uncharacterized protein n=1 Tax=Blastomyces percursus TaxID=1658174 RepID=A0A1J9Q0V1_9EURO|nr:hypothetical protein ACJ73_10032 [Blastomyces percursus]
MSSTFGLYVAIFDDGGVYKHRSLFIDGSTDAEKTILHVMGSSTRYRFDMRNSNAHKSATLSEMVHLCDVDKFKIGAIKDAAKNVVIHNEYSGYNCQDYVLDLLDDLEEKDIIDKNEVNYRHNKEAVRGKQEGLA